MPLQSVYNSLILQTRARSSLPSGESGQHPQGSTWCLGLTTSAQAKLPRPLWLRHRLCGGPEVFWGEACPARSLNSGSQRKHDRRRQSFQPPSGAAVEQGWAGPAVVLPTSWSRGSAGQVPKQNPRHGALYAFIQSHSMEKLLENTRPCLRIHQSSSAGT